jgi:hypothetical protein
MAEQRPKSRAGRAAGLVLFVGAAILLLRMLGPGGAPTAGPQPPAPAPAPAPSPSPSSVKGRVLEPDGTPAAGVTVDVVYEGASGGAGLGPRLPAPTGPDGRFDLPPGVRVRALRASRGPLSVEVDLGGAAGPADLDLRLPAVFEAAGLVVAAEDGRPLEGMTVSVGDSKTRTDALGRFRLEGLPAALLKTPPVLLEAQGAGRKPVRHDLAVQTRADDLLLRAERE